MTVAFVHPTDVKSGAYKNIVIEIKDVPTDNTECSNFLRNLEVRYFFFYMIFWYKYFSTFILSSSAINAFESSFSFLNKIFFVRNSLIQDLYGKNFIQKKLVPSAI